MRALPSATTVCRVLIGLDRARASGTLHVHGEGRRATISFESSQIVGANVDRRVATSHRQVFESVLQMCAWEGLVLRLVQEPAAATWWKLADPVPARAVALQTMRAAVKGVDTASVRAELGNTVYHLTEAGESLTHGAELRPEETAVLFWLRRGVPAEELSTLPECGLAGPRFLWMLKLLAGAASASTRIRRDRDRARRRRIAHCLRTSRLGSRRSDHSVRWCTCNASAGFNPSASSVARRSKADGTRSPSRSPSARNVTEPKSPSPISSQPSWLGV